MVLSLCVPNLSCFGAPGRLCFETVAFSGYLHIFLSVITKDSALFLRIHYK